MWPFKKNRGLVKLPDVVLTKEERDECESFIRSMTHSDGGANYVRADLADSFQRYFMSICLFGRAERFKILSSGEPSNATKACEAAAKACAIFPISSSFYEFALILAGVGKKGEARAMFEEFLRRVGAEELNDVEKLAMKRLDSNEAIARAKEALRS